MCSPVSQYIYSVSVSRIYILERTKKRQTILWKGIIHHLTPSICSRHILFLWSNIVNNCWPIQLTNRSNRLCSTLLMSRILRLKLWSVIRTISIWWLIILLHYLLWVSSIGWSQYLQIEFGNRLGTCFKLIFGKKRPFGVMDTSLLQLVMFLLTQFVCILSHKVNVAIHLLR